MVINKDLLPGGSRKVKAKKKVKKASSSDCAPQEQPKTVAPTPEYARRSPPEDPMKDRPKKEDAVEVGDSAKSE